MKKLSLLILDKDAYYAGIFASRFEASGWKVTVAESIEMAKTMLDKQVPDAMIIDTEPFEEAVEFIRTLRHGEKTSELVITVLSSVGDRHHILQAQDAGIDGYFFKGHFLPSEAIQKLKRLVAERG
jgi:DNA-binding response OmpR family regulator